MKLSVVFLVSGLSYILPQGDGQRIAGLTKADSSCLCQVNSSVWAFPAPKYEKVLQLVQDCEVSLQQLNDTVTEGYEELPKFQEVIRNLTARLEPFQDLHHKGLYTSLHLRELRGELDQLEKDIGSIHQEKQSKETQKLTDEVVDVLEQVEKMQMSNVVNMKTVRNKLRYLKNGLESCRSIPEDFKSMCSKRLLTSISSPVVTKLSPFGKSYTSGSWGRQAKKTASQEEVDRGEQKEVVEDSYWVLYLTSGYYSNVLRLYSSYEDFMGAQKHTDVNVAPSSTHANAMQGPGTVLYGNGLFFNCYNSPDLCRYDLKTKTTRRLKLPGAGFNSQFSYCYYDCRSHTDIDFAVDETGLWVIYSTLGNHGNLVLSRLDPDAFNVTHTWMTQQFKKSVTNAFMVCGVLYATRYGDEFHEEVFYAFDTKTGQEDNTLAISMEKVAKGVASLSYNPIDKHLYMYNDAYMLSYQTAFF